MDYLLISPVRNEERHLPALAESVIAQTQLPGLWLIVDDGSTDQTPSIIEKLCFQYPWIISRKLAANQGGLGLHFGEIMRFGFGEVIKAAEDKKIDYQIIGKADADVVIPSTCFQELVKVFSENKLLGIASPVLIIRNNKNSSLQKKNRWDMAFGDHPTDGVRLIRKECYDEIGGYLVSRAPETVAEAKAKIRGWQLRRCKNIFAYLQRISHETTPVWTRWAMSGSEVHYLGYSPLLAMGHFCYEILFGHPWYRSWAYLWGYIKSVVQREPRIPDEEILHYFGKQRIKEIVPQFPELLRYIFMKVPK
jgi:glycosyltransferase involved in cell wall biosynthesis